MFGTVSLSHQHDQHLVQPVASGCTDAVANDDIGVNCVGSVR